MSILATNTTIIPCLRYRDAHAAIEWLCATFGFETSGCLSGRRRHDRARPTHVRQRHDHGRVEARHASSAGSSSSPMKSVAARRRRRTSSWPMPTPCTPARRRPAPRFSSTSRPKTTAAAISRAAIRRGTSGASARTIRGHRHRSSELPCRIRTPRWLQYGTANTQTPILKSRVPISQPRPHCGLYLNVRDSACLIPWERNWRHVIWRKSLEVGTTSFSAFFVALHARHN